jgi:hypothetical protein
MQSFTPAATQTFNFFPDSRDCRLVSNFQQDKLFFKQAALLSRGSETAGRLKPLFACPAQPFSGPATLCELRSGSAELRMLAGSIDAISSNRAPFPR